MNKKQFIENKIKMDYNKNVTINCNHYLSSNRPDLVENCLKILENFTLMLLSTNEKFNNESKLNYCYCYFNKIRWQLDNPLYFKRNILIEISKSIINRLKASLKLLHPPHRIPYDFLNQINPKFKLTTLNSSVLINNVFGKKRKRKSKFQKTSSVEAKHVDHGKKLMNKLYGNLFYPSKDISLNIQYIIDKMYIQIRTVLSENCIDETDILHEFDASVNQDYLSESMKESKRLSPISKKIYNTGYQQKHLWSGDCRMDENSQNILFDQSHHYIARDNFDISTNFFADNLSLNDKAYFQKTRFRKDSELDEGFSENEFLSEIDNKLDGNESVEVLLSYERFSCCGDNSSNSMSDELDYKESTGPYIDDGSDSDGGTEILNSVNDSLNKFNAFMEHTLNPENKLQLEEKSSSNGCTNNSDQLIFHNIWSFRNQEHSDTRVSQDLSNQTVSLEKRKSFDKTNMTTLTDSNPVLSSILNNIVSKDDCLEQSNNINQLSSLPRFSNVNYDVISKLLVSPINIQNLRSYSFSQDSFTSSFNYQTQATKMVEANNSVTGGLCIDKYYNWLPALSQGLVNTNSFSIGSNSLQPQVHRVVPYFTIPSGNEGHIEHNILHLQQIFHNVPHQVMETEYYDYRHNPIINKYNPYCDLNNPNYPMVTVKNPTNSNCSNINRQQPISLTKTAVSKSQRACCFYMRGGCKKEDCEYAHDLSKVTCKFWEKGDCFKADTCPFKHGYTKE